MAPKNILYPLIGSLVLVFLVMLRLMFSRNQAIKDKILTWNSYKVLPAGAEPPRAAAVTRNFANLFEMPLLFYPVIILMYVTARLNNADVGSEAVVLAWAFVVFRALHSLVHVTFNHVKVRFVFYLASTVVLFILWIDFFYNWYL